MSAATGVVVRPLGDRFGAEVTGLGPLDELPRAALDEVRDLLLEHRVLGLRDQHLDAARHERLAERLGPGAPAARADRVRRVPHSLDVADLAPARLPAPSRWISGASYRLAPPAVIAIRTTSEAVGEDTRFADAVGAYRDLPAPLRALADRCWAVHTRRAEEPEAPGSAAHPVTRLHTETGERALLIGGHARRVPGFGVAESRAVIALLQSSVERPHNLLRWAWRPGDLVLVDARAVQWHAGTATGARTATAWRELSAETPLGVDGQHSHAAGTGLPAGLLTA